MEARDPEKGVRRRVVSPNQHARIINAQSVDGASDIDATADWCMNGSLPACFNACSVLLSNRLNDIQSQSSALVAENSVVFHHFMINLRIFNRPFLSSFPHSLG